jgi:hypothetical protein
LFQEHVGQALWKPGAGFSTGKNFSGSLPTSSIAATCQTSPSTWHIKKSGIGRELIRRTQSRLGIRAKIILLAAPKAEGYYPRIGFEPHPSAWILPAAKGLK